MTEKDIESGENAPQISEKIITSVVEDEMKTAYLDYAMSVIIGRALPDAPVISRFIQWRLLSRIVMLSPLCALFPCLVHLPLILHPQWLNCN